MKTYKLIINIFVLIVFLFVSFVRSTPVHAASVLYVKLNGSGNCSSWAQACKLQTALTNAVYGDEIWVAAGTHKPTTSFALTNGVAVYGGFSGSETLRSQRNPKTRVTILSGDIGVVGDNSDNTYNVVTSNNVDDSTILDGFTISGGNAQGSFQPFNGGGGMNNINSSPIISNVIFSNSYGQYGGGMYNNNSSPTLINVTFKNNTAYEAAGMYNENNTHSTLLNVVFDGNVPYWDKAAMANLSSTAELYYVVFNNNGGGMYNSNADVVLDNVIFMNNATAAGGGIRNNSSTLTISNSVFDSNSSTNGGAIHTSSSIVNIFNTTFYNNQASNSCCGGGSGGAIWKHHGHVTMTNVTGVGNSVNGAGPFILNYANFGTVTIHNSIIWGNTGSIPLLSAGHTVTYSIIQGGYSGTGNSYFDPMIQPLADNGGFTPTMAIPTNSPAVDAVVGNSNCPTTDQRGVARPKDAYCDIGAYEYSGTVSSALLKVTSIVRNNDNPTNLSNVSFTVIFSKPVDGVDVSDFVLTTTGITGAFITDVSGSGTTYVVTLNTGNGLGTIRLDVVDDDSILDYAASPLGGYGFGNGNFTSGQIYTVEKNSVTSILRLSTNPTNSSTISFQVTFSDEETGIDVSDFLLTQTGTLSGVVIESISDSGSIYTVTVNTGSGDGTIRLDVIDDDTILDTSLEPLGGVGAGNGSFTTGEIYTIDKTPPTVSTITRVGVSPSNMHNVSYLVTFSENVIGVDVTDFTLNTTGVAGATVSNVSGSGNTRVVSVNTGQGSGTIELEFIDDDSVTDLASNPTTSGLTGETYTIQKPQLKAPVLRSPRSGGALNDTTPNFIWQRMTGAQSYEIQVDNNSDFLSLEVNSNNIISTNYETSIALSEGTYYWRVRGNDVSGNPGKWSLVRTIIIDTTGPAAPTLISPSGTVTSRTVTFRWSAVSDAVQYELARADDIACTTNSVSLATLRGTTRRMNMPSGTYYWCVRAKDSLGNWGNWASLQITVP